MPAGKKFYVEVKCGPEIVPAMLEDLAASGLKDEQVVVISFQAPVIAELKKHKPEYKACWLSSFEKESPLDPGTDEVLATVRKIGANGFSSKADARLDADFVKTVRDAGFEYRGQTVFTSAFGGDEVVVILERNRKAVPQLFEYHLLATSKTGRMQKELEDAGEHGFAFVGMTVGKTAMGGNEVVVITRRERR